MPTPLAAPFRLARPEDCLAMAPWANAAGVGLPAAHWAEVAKTEGRADEDPMVIGAEGLAAACARGIVLTADAGEGPLGLLVSYPAPTGPAPADLPPWFAPVAELEHGAPGAWYVKTLAAAPEARGSGLGPRLLAEADRMSAEAGLDGISLVVSEGNVNAIRFYLREGFRQIGQAPQVAAPGWAPHGPNWFLMRREAGGAGRAG